jgi:hypothetical protein
VVKAAVNHLSQLPRLLLVLLARILLVYLHIVRKHNVAEHQPVVPVLNLDELADLVWRRSSSTDTDLREYVFVWLLERVKGREQRTDIMAVISTSYEKTPSFQ